MAVVNTNVNASIAQNALTRNERADEYGHGAVVDWSKNQFRPKTMPPDLLSRHE